MATQTDILGLLAYLEAAYPTYLAHERTHEVYFTELRDVPIETLFLAARMHIAVNRYFPSVHELRARVVELRPDRQVARSGREAWEAVVGEIDRVGYVGTPDLRDPLVVTIVHEMGWRNLCLSAEPEAERKHFIARYDERLRRETDLALLPPDLRAAVSALTIGQPMAQLMEGQR